MIGLVKWYTNWVSYNLVNIIWESEYICWGILRGYSQFYVDCLFTLPLKKEGKITLTFPEVSLNDKDIPSNLKIDTNLS